MLATRSVTRIGLVLAGAVWTWASAGEAWAQSGPTSRGASRPLEPTRVATPPPMHPANGAFRFALELGALGAMGFWGYEQSETPSRYALMVGVPVAAAAAWGIFAVPNDPSRGGTPVVAVPGALRLALEVAFFGFASWALNDLGHQSLALGFGGATVVHYALSYRRLKWLLDQ